jgi:hypothetical protein
MGLIFIESLVRIGKVIEFRAEEAGVPERHISFIALTKIPCSSGLNPVVGIIDM